MTALPSGAVDATVRNGTSTAAIHSSPAGDEWAVSMDRSDDGSASGPDHVVTSVDDVVTVLGAYWRPVTAERLPRSYR